MFQLEYLSRFSASRNGVTGRRRRLGFKQTCLAPFTPKGISDEKIKKGFARPGRLYCQNVDFLLHHELC